MLRRNTPRVSKRGSIDGESEPNPPVKYRVRSIQVLLHPPRVRMALSLSVTVQSAAFAEIKKVLLRTFGYL